MRDRKEQILDAAAELLQSRGFTGFSYQDLSDRLGITKASIHHHFATKESLGVALTERYIASYRNALDEIERNSNDPWDRLDGYVDLISRIMQSGNKICPGGILLADYMALPERMQDGACRHCSLVREWLARVVGEGREQGVMMFSGDAGDQAAVIQAAIQGAVQIARAHGPQEFTRVVRQLRQGMKGGK